MERAKMILLSLILCASMGMSAANPEDSEWKAPSKFFNIGFAYSTISQNDSPDIKSDFGISLTKATTYYLHKPIAGRLRFGIEAVWSDIAYSNYKVNYISLKDPDESYKETLHAFEYTLQVGAAVNFNITPKTSLHGYFRYSPGFSALYDGDRFMGGFFNGATGGLLINYKKICAGFEWRFGQAKHKKLLALSDFSLDGSSASDVDKKTKTKLSGLRAYVSLTF